MRRLSMIGLLGLLVAVAAVGPSSALAASGRVQRIFKRACNTPSAGHASCFAIAVTNPDGTTPGAAAPLASPNAVSPAVTPAGFGPGDLQSAYSVASAAASSGGNRTVAIVDAYDDPNAASDLANYRSTYGLPPCGPGCFTKVNQSGGTSYPSGDAGWGEEISLDLDMVSAICPNCKIILVEASSSTLASLGTAVNEAAKLGATQISNSYGGGESGSENSYSTSYFNHPGVDIMVSSGDGGFGVEYPAASQYVTAVGGTSLSRASNTRGWSESAWSGAGSGCSAYAPKPTWQLDTGCPRRMVADVSAVADPNTGVAVYDTYGEKGWMVFGGTSVASPVVASIYALAGGRSPGSTFGSYAYGNIGQYNDVTSGSNGSCSGTYQCTGRVGYDGPTGIGTPNGAGPVGPPPPPPPPPTPPVNTALPSISGTLAAGQVLSANPGAWTPSPTSYTYLWERCTANSVAACSSTGASGSTYTLTGADAGDFVTVIVTASDGATSLPATAPLVGPVASAPPPPPASFSLSASPTSVSVSQSKSAAYAITVNGVNGFTGSVAFSASGLPSGVTASFSPLTSTTKTTLTLKTASSSPTGAHPVVITGTSGGFAAASTTVNLTINRCFIFCF
jgi:hypothetical protein